MRILIVSAYFETHRGGIEIIAGALAKEFRRARQTVTWIASGSDPVPSDDLSGRRVPLGVHNGIENLLGVPFPLPGPSALKAIRREVMASGVVMIHDALYPANIAAFLLARWLGKPVVMTQHIDSVPYANPLLRLLMRCMNRIVTRPILAAADQVVFMSKLTAEKFKNVVYRRAPQLIFSGADPDIFRPARDAGERAAIRQQFGISSDRPIALFVGRFVEKKGLHILHHAAQLGGEIDWVLAGWGNIDPTTWELPNVRVLQGLNQEALAPLYRAADVFVLPSVGEGFPLVLQEAALCGLPMVCGAETAKADEKLLPLLYPVDIEYRDPAETATDVVAVVRRAINENDASQAMARSAQVRARYSWPHAAELYLGLFSDVLKTSSVDTKAGSNRLSAARVD